MINKTHYAATLAGVGLVVVALVSTGCERTGTPGGPGASATGTKPPLYGEADNTFDLTTHSASLKQGEAKPVSIGIKRGTNFQGDVAITFADIPQGVTIEPTSTAIKHGDTEAKVTIKAGPDASLGDFMIKVTGHPTKGSNALVDLKLSVSKDSEVAATAQRDEYVREMQKQLSELDVKYEAMKASAAKAEGQAKKDLEKKLEEAKVKRDVAAKKLVEVKEAAPDRWVKIKDGFGNAFDDLKKMFN